MMDNHKSHVPCQSWAGQHGWSSTSTQGPLLDTLPSSQHQHLGSSSDQRPFYQHQQESDQSCMRDPGTILSGNTTHHSALYKASHISSNPSSNTLFANTATPSSSHINPFAQQNPHTSPMLLSANQGKNILLPSLPQTNQSPQPCRPQHPPLLSPHDLYKAPFQPLLTNQGLPDGLLPISLPPCGQHEQRQWIPSSNCMGAVHESVPGAALPNNVPSQEGNMSSPASYERQRSVLLQQRAQLLHQVAQLDKLLESINPEDGSGGQSPHAAIQPPPPMEKSSQFEQTKTSGAQQVQLQSKPHISTDCSSPASHEEPMSSNVKSEENESAESEVDSDSDYLPDSDADLFDSPFHSEGSSSDEFSHIKPSTPTNKKPSLTEKKEDESESSMSEDNTDSAPKQTPAITQKEKSSDTVVLPCSSSKGRRVYDKRNYCLYCAKPVFKLSRHLERNHSDKKEVAAAFQYPTKSKERQRIWNRLTNLGNFAHNKDVLKSGKGQLAARKRPSQTKKAKDFLHCLHCRGLFLRKPMYRHMKVCPERVKNETVFGRKNIASRCALQTLGDLSITDGFRNILSDMIYDDVTQTAMEDEVLLQFGELMFTHHGTDPKKHEYIRQYLRQLARLVLEAKKITPLEKLKDFFLPSCFPHVVSAVNVVAGYNAENKTYSNPSLAIKLGYHLQKACGIVEGNAVKSGDERSAESARNFLSLYKRKWNKHISAGALTAIKKTKLKRAKKVPFAQDVMRLNIHVENVHLLAEKNLRESPCAENYAALANVILSRTIFFNRRSVLEVSSVELTAFESRQKSNLQDGMDISVTDLEKKMCRFFVRINIPGKCGRTVPVLLKPSLESAIELLVKVRETCGVPSQNPYLFGRPNALTAYAGAQCIQKYVKECGAKDPAALTSSKIRKHYGKMLQLMNLNEAEADQILGPNNQVRSLGQQLDDVEMHSDERGQQAASWDYNEPSGAGCEPTSTNVTVTSKYFESDKKGSKIKGKHKWEEAEVLAVERHMMRLIKEYKVPQKDECVQCLEAEPALRTRSWKGVKDYVRNRITALKRTPKQ
ncbi:uncharacterized protein LOC117472878 isoform X2 [Trematomus bernacchii]|uniref:uncharacterized protein LOC117472878 isoform X2 n=1 Tax=Trematomus bernacchii TaxID=40690 RepID=UPI00146F2A12|nr:uncharacterized protein LOC117472878 isoform X2 [Trematomus bernacchii]